MNRKPNDANKGLNVPHFMEAVGIALAVLLVSMLVFVLGSRNNIFRRMDHPKPTNAVSPQ